MPHPTNMTEQVRVFAQLRYSEMSSREDVNHHADPLEVGRLAAKLAARFFFGDLTTTQSSQVTLATRAGMLVYAMERWGYNFEEISTLAEFPVAAVVSGLSPDCRMPCGKRQDFHCSTLSQADPMSQLVKLAEIIATCEHVLAVFTTYDLALHAAHLKQWADDSYSLVTAMTHLRDNKRMKTIVVETKAKLQTLIRNAEEARRPRARMMAPVTATAI